MVQCVSMFGLPQNWPNAFSWASSRMQTRSCRNIPFRNAFGEKNGTMAPGWTRPSATLCIPSTTNKQRGALRFQFGGGADFGSTKGIQKFNGARVSLHLRFAARQPRNKGQIDLTAFPMPFQ